MSNANLLSLAGVTNTSNDVLFIVLFLLASVIVFFGAVVLLGMFINKPKSVAVKAEAADTSDEKSSIKKFNYIGVLLAVLGLGFILRLLMVFMIKGYREDYNILASLMSTITANGMKGAYEGGSFLNYPVVVYIYSFISWLTRLFNMDATSTYMPTLVKLPFIICDILAALLLYRAAKTYVNDQTALIVAAFYMLFPLFMFSSAVWGSVYSVLSLLIIATFYFIVRKKYMFVVIAYSLALLTMKEALYLYPVIAVYLIYNYVKYCTGLRKTARKTVSEIMADKEYRNVILLPIYLIVSTAAMYLITLPVMRGQTSNFFSFLNNIFFRPLSEMSLFGRNSLGIYNLFGRNGIELVTTFPTVVFSVLFGVIITALIMLIYLSRKNRANLTFLAAFIILTLSVFYMDFTEMSLMPALGLILLALVLIRDKRLFQLFGGISLAVLVNGIAVMAGAGYLNNLTDSELLVAAYTGTTLLSEGFPLALSICCTVFTMLMYIYSVMILLDLSMSNKRKTFADIKSSRNALTGIKEFFKK